MRAISLLVRGVLWVLLLALLVAAAVFFWLRGTTTPKWAGAVTTGGTLGSEVKVTRDAWGVPHIRARTDEDAVFALGYVHWQDRAWQMDFQRRVAQGRLSEVLGDATLNQDKFLRTWGFQRAAQSALPALAPRTRRLIAAYTAGVNAAMKSGKSALEFQILRYTPEAWTDVDSVSWSKLMAFDLGGNYEQEVIGAAVVGRLGQAGLAQVFPPYPAGAPTVLSAEEIGVQREVAGPPTDTAAHLTDATLAALRANLRAAQALGMQAVPGKGSNNWVVGGSRTSSGKPLLADDPHLALSSPMLWYLADIQGKDLRAIGASIPGLPAIVIGRNERVAWGVTNVNPDVQDLYLEPPGTPLSSRTEVIKVKGQPDVTLTVRESRHGPIISGQGAGTLGAGGQQVALKWTALQPGDTTMDAFLGLNYARDWADFTGALRSYVAPSQNFVYADVDGNTGYYAPGRVPTRQGWDGSLPVSGDGSREWTGFIPFERLPHTFNPADGLVVSANNRVVPQSYAFNLGNERNWAAPYRARRITDLLTAKPGGLTLDDMKKVQLDAHSLVWDDLKSSLLATVPKDDAGRRALERLRDWDGDLTVSSVPGTIFETWLIELQKLGQDDYGDTFTLNSLAVRNQLATQGAFCGSDGTCADDLARTLDAAVGHLTERLGPDPSGWQYGKLHRVASDHQVFGKISPLDRVFNHSAPTPGGTDTVNVARPDPLTFRQTHGASYRQIVDLSDPNRSLYVGSLGQSGNPLLPHAADQQNLWVQGGYLPMSTDPADWGRTQTMTLK
ncbi:penicillin acylase family protein [Deinococcus sp. VB343]|uniref:Penicillin acylase family protein n=1 Tax=Deinococcus sp. VB142 TaxID=3112952 RepID=A0AAU6Q6A3_9DEIO